MLFSMTMDRYLWVAEDRKALYFRRALFKLNYPMVCDLRVPYDRKHFILIGLYLSLINPWFLIFPYQRTINPFLISTHTYACFS